MTTTRTTTALAALWMCAYLQNWHRWLLLHGPVQRRRERAGSVGHVQEVQFLLQGGQRMRNYQSVWLLHGLRLWRSLRRNISPLPRRQRPSPHPKFRRREVLARLSFADVELRASAILRERGETRVEPVTAQANPAPESLIVALPPGHRRPRPRPSPSRRPHRRQRPHQFR